MLGYLIKRDLEMEHMNILIQINAPSTNQFKKIKNSHNKKECY